MILSLDHTQRYAHARMRFIRITKRQRSCRWRSPIVYTAVVQSTLSSSQKNLLSDDTSMMKWVMLWPKAVLRKLISFLILASLGEAVSPFQEAKETLKNERGLILVPVLRNKRAIDDNPTHHQTKYKRLSHSVHVQTDIRYR